ncbi:MAG: hypothetical protein ABIF08_04570 [Nanoarchaeota archaeon]
MDFDDVMIIILLAVVLFGVGIGIQTFSEKTQMNIQLDMRQMSLLDSTSILEACLKSEDTDYIDIETLRSLGSTATDFRGFCEGTERKQLYNLPQLAGAKVVDLKTKEEWKSIDFDELLTQENTHTVFVNINDDETVHVGKLYVQI